MPTPNKKRHPLRHGNGYGPDFANVFHVRRLMRNSFADEVRAATAGAGMLVYRAVLENDSAAVVSMGLGARLPDARWIAGSWTNATTTFADDTTDAQDAGANDFPLQTLLANDGHIVACRERFGAVIYTVGTAAVDAAGAGGVTGEWTYWNGSAWTVFTPVAITLDGGAGGRFYSAGRHEMVFEPPADWTAATTANVTGLPAGDWFAIRYRATDAPDTTAALATILQVWDPWRVAQSQVAANSSVVVESSHGLAVCGDGEGLVVVTTTADAGNLINVVGEDAGEARTLGAEDGRTFIGQT